MIVLAFYLKIYFKEEILMSNEEKNLEELGKNSESLNDVAGGFMQGVPGLITTKPALQDFGILLVFRSATTTDEVKAIAAANGIKITDSGAEHVLKGLTILRSGVAELKGAQPVSDSEVNKVSGGLLAPGLNQIETQVVSSAGASFAIKFGKNGNVYFRAKVKDPKTGKMKNRWFRSDKENASALLGAELSIDPNSGATITGPNGK